MESYQDLIKQREELEQRIAQARKRENADAIARAREIIAQHNLSVQDVFPAGRGAAKVARAGSKVAPKYRNPATGQTWTGRGKAPKWIEGQNRAAFTI